MAEPSASERGKAARALPSNAPSVIAALAMSSQVQADPPDPYEGPDYVDDWMQKNLAPNVIRFVRSCCTSFTRWDLLRRLKGAPHGTTSESLARAIGASSIAASDELESLARLGLVSRRSLGGQTTYRLDLSTDMGRALDLALRAYDDSQEFRFALVYAIARASHRGAAQE